MNSKTITQLVIVRGDTAEEFQDKFNSTMAALADQNPQFKFNPDLDRFEKVTTYNASDELYYRIGEDYKLINEGELIAIALSGGKDSVLTLHALKNYQNYLKLV